jgi:hypothetical protein
MYSIMRIGVAMALAAVVWLPTHDVRLRAQAQAQAPTQAAAVAPQETQETWEQYQGPAAEKFLKDARVRSMRALGTGVTLPQKAELVLDGVTHNAVFKTIDERKPGITQFNNSAEMNFQDSWQLEVAAYQVDRTIGLKLVPATIERYINNNHGSLQWWVQNKMSEADRRKQNAEPPDRDAWDKVWLKMYLFDQLIANVDRHMNNILITADWDLRLIDHSRSFRSTKELKDPRLFTRFSRDLVEGIKKLEYQDMKKKVGKYLMDEQIKTMLIRRDLILKLVSERVAAVGEAKALY